MTYSVRPESTHATVSCELATSQPTAPAYFSDVTAMLKSSMTVVNSSYTLLFQFGASLFSHVHCVISDLIKGV